MSPGEVSPEVPAPREDSSGPVQRALAILEALSSAAESGSLGVVEIARKVGREKSQVSRALRILADVGFVDREPETLRYRLGARLFAVAAKAVPRRLLEESERATERLADQVGERAEVLARSGTEAVTIATTAPRHVLLAVGWVGRTQPLTSTAAGRSLLFDLADDELARVVAAAGLPEGGPLAPRSLDDVVRRVRTDAARGYSVCAQEADRELIAVGAPVRDAHGRTIAGLQVCGPLERMEEAMDDAVKRILVAAQQVSVAVGADRDPPVARPDGTPLLGTGGCS